MTAARPEPVLPPTMNNSAIRSVVKATDAHMKTFSVVAHVDRLGETAVGETDAGWLHHSVVSGLLRGKDLAQECYLRACPQ